MQALTEQALVDLLLEMVPRGEAHARSFTSSDSQELEVCLTLQILYLEAMPFVPTRKCNSQDYSSIGMWYFRLLLHSVCWGV